MPTDPITITESPAADQLRTTAAFYGPNQANAILGIYGITGAGKTSLAVTGVEEAWEVHRAITLWYAADLGGWGNKLLSLIRLGIVRVWYIRSHRSPVATVQLASRGYWPVKIDDPETGIASPDVALIAPRTERFVLVCPNGHPAATYSSQHVLIAAQAVCPTCQTVTNVTNAREVTRQVVRPAMFARVGHRVYDSMTQINEWGLESLREKSALGELPASSTGGSALGSADALRETINGEDVVFGTGSKAQYGFLQDRTNTWLANIRAIPDHVLPPTVTFGVEQSKGGDDSGGQPIYGPKIAGNARTSAVGGWTGNLLYAAKEPHGTNPPERDAYGNVVMYHRLWLTNHVSPTDALGIPIVAKHRGEPDGIPAYLEDPADPAKAWSVCSLRVFYRLMREQAVWIAERDAARYTDAPGLVNEAIAADEIVDDGSAATSAGAGVAGSTTAMVSQGNAGTTVAAPSRIVRRSRRPGVGGGAPIINEAGSIPPRIVPVEPVSAAARIESVAAIVGVPLGEALTPASTPSSPIADQLRASLAAATATTVERTEPTVRMEVTQTPAATATAPPVDSSAPPKSSAQSTTINRIRRVPRPPTS